MFAASSVAPPVVELGRLAGWQPLALSVRDARRRAGPLRQRLSQQLTQQPIPSARPGAATGASTALSARGMLVRHGDTVAVNGIDLDLPTGQVAALMGRNGSGKSSLLWALQGAGPRQGGSVRVRDTDPRSVSAAAARRLVGLVPQTPTDLLYLDRVADELAQADRDGVSTVSARRLLDRLSPGIDDASHPRDLSEGQRLSLVLAIQLCATPLVVLLDEPTRGLDYVAKLALVGIVDSLAAQGRSIVIATHDVEFVAAAADRVIVMAGGDIVADGPTAEVIVASPAFAPQVAKVLAPLPYLTVAQVAAALDEAGN
jgi:ABC-type multidrug transport system ATPase subunit